jgi:hypothetical protein
MHRVDTNPYIFTHPWWFKSESNKFFQPANGTTSRLQPTLSGLIFISKNLVHTSQQRTRSASIEKTSRLMLSSEMICTCYENYGTQESLLYVKIQSFLMVHKITTKIYERNQAQYFYRNGIFGPGWWKNLQGEELHNLNSLLNTIISSSKEWCNRWDT